MPRKNFYISDADEEYYQLAKKYAGESLSSVIVQGIKAFVTKRQMEEKGMEEVVIFVGKHYNLDQMSQGENQRFIGMLLSEFRTQDVHGDGFTFRHRLYLTRKGKFLMHTLQIDGSGDCDVSTRQIFSTFAEVTARGYPMQMLNEARKKIPEMTCEDLDV